MENINDYNLELMSSDELEVLLSKLTSKNGMDDIVKVHKASHAAVIKESVIGILDENFELIEGDFADFTHEKWYGVVELEKVYHGKEYVWEPKVLPLKHWRGIDRGTRWQER